jgi:two-component SAPR family response regulator
MNEIKAIIADDDESFSSHMEDLLSDIWPDLVVCARAKTGPEALELIHRHKPHLAFIRSFRGCGTQ